MKIHLGEYYNPKAMTVAVIKEAMRGLKINLSCPVSLRHIVDGKLKDLGLDNPDFVNKTNESSFGYRFKNGGCLDVEIASDKPKTRSVEKHDKFAKAMKALEKQVEEIIWKKPKNFMGLPPPSVPNEFFGEEHLSGIQEEMDQLVERIRSLGPLSQPRLLLRPSQPPDAGDPEIKLNAELKEFLEKKSKRIRDDDAKTRLRGECTCGGDIILPPSGRRLCCSCGRWYHDNPPTKFTQPQPERLYAISGHCSRCGSTMGCMCPREKSRP
jgi:hypothetical protein